MAVDMRSLIQRVARRLRRPLRLDLDAYILFRSQLDVQQHAVATIDGDNCGIHFTELDPHNMNHMRGIAGITDSPATKLVGENELTLRRTANRFREGERCFGAMFKDEVVGMFWASFPGHFVYRTFAALVNDVPHSCVFNGAYVNPQYRGARIQRRLDAVMKAVLAQEGIRTVFTFVGVRNFASIVNCLRCNEEYRLIYHLSVDLPFLPKINMYPKRATEAWRSCQP